MYLDSLWLVAWSVDLVWFGSWAARLVGRSVGGRSDAVVSSDVLFE